MIAEQKKLDVHNTSEGNWVWLGITGAAQKKGYFLVKERVLEWTGQKASL